MGYQRVNLYHLYTAKVLNIKDFRLYEKILSNRNKSTNVGEREKDSLYFLIQVLLSNNCSINKLGNFYYSFPI